MKSSIQISFGLLLLMLLNGECLLASQNDPVLDKFVASWKKKQTNAKAVRYVASGKWVVYPRDETGNIGKKPKVLTIEHDFLIDWPTQRYRLETKEQTDTGYRIAIGIYTGKMTKSRVRFLLPDGMNDPAYKEYISIGEGNHQSAIFETGQFWPMFFAGGSLPSSHRDVFYPGQFRLPVNSDLFYAHGQEVINGKSLPTIRTYPYGEQKIHYEFVADSEKEYTVSKLSMIYGENSRLFCLFVKNQQIQSGWHPKSWRFEKYSGKNLQNYYEFTINKVEFPDVSDVDFDIQAKDQELIKKTTYETDDVIGVKPGESTLFQQRGNSLVEVEIIDGKIAEKNNQLYLVMFGSFFCLIILGIFVYFIRKRKRIVDSI